MRLTTIWTIPVMSLPERFRRTGEWLAIQTAAHLPRRVRYWVYILEGSKAMKPDELVTDVPFMDLLKRMD